MTTVTDCCLFNRPHHQRVAKLLAVLDVEFLAESKCYFCGGTAITLSLGEYRESVDVEFLCNSEDGYRRLRETITSDSLGSILAGDVELAREVRADRYGIRTFVRIDGVPIKFDIVREGRIDLTGVIDGMLGVPTLSREDMFAETLLANADRCGDITLASRDAIDLAMLIAHWGTIPDAAWSKARRAYGRSIDNAYGKAIALVSDGDYLISCLIQVGMERTLVERIPALLRGSLPASAA